MKLLVFAGTSEGRELCQVLSARGLTATACVATEYGRMSMPELAGITIRQGRMDKMEMEAFVKGFALVIDATHPYAALATENIKAACLAGKVEYLRLLRPGIQPSQAVIPVASAQAAAEYLKGTEGAVLLTTGSKELAVFKQIPQYQKRLFARVLPSPEVVESCCRLGFQGAHLICMQGPFSYEMNVALLKMTNAKFLVTKDTGEAGGFKEKLEAAEKMGVKVLLITRPIKESGYTLQEVISRICGDKNPRFPLFVDLTDKKCVVIGAGEIASRRIRVLLDYGAQVTVIAPEIKERLHGAAYIKRAFQPGDCKGAYLAVAAASDRAVNRSVGEECRAFGIPVSVADCAQECTFYFPAVCQTGKLSVGLVSDGTNHSLTAETAQKIRALIKGGTV